MKTRIYLLIEKARIINVKLQSKRGKVKNSYLIKNRSQMSSIILPYRELVTTILILIQSKLGTISFQFFRIFLSNSIILLV